MSHAAMTWAQEARTGSGTRKCVLLLMADGADEHGILWWSVKRIVAKSELSRRTVLTALKDMDAAGLIMAIDRRRDNGTQQSSLYLLAPQGERMALSPWKEGDEGHVKLITAEFARRTTDDQGAATAPGSQGAPAADQGAADAQQGAAVAHQGAGDAPLESSLEPSLDPTPEPRKTRAPAQAALLDLDPVTQPTTADGVTKVPAELAESFAIVMPVLSRVAGAKRALAVKPDAVIRMLSSKTLKDHRHEAEAFEHYWLDGSGQARPMKDAVATYRTWVSRQPDIQPLPVHGSRSATRSGTIGNTSGRRLSNAEMVRQNIDQGRELARQLREGSAPHDPR